MNKELCATSSNLSTVKAVALLELLARKGKMRLIDIAAALDMNTSTALRFLSALQSEGYVVHDKSEMKYALTFKICRIAEMHNTRTGIYEVTHPYVAKLAEEFGESVCISIEQNMSMVYVDVASDPTKALMSRQSIGGTVPMHCTGNGKIILSTYPEAKLREYCEKSGLPRFTDNTIVELDRLMSELELIRKQGYSVDDEEIESGLRCVSVGLKNYTGQIVAGVCVTGPAARITMDMINEYLPRMREAGRDLSLLLGYDGD